MHIVRWLFVHPIAFAWILAFIAILLNWTFGGKPHDTTAKQDGQTQVAEVNQSSTAPTAQAVAATPAAAAEATQSAESAEQKAEAAEAKAEEAADKADTAEQKAEVAEEKAEEAADQVASAENAATQTTEATQTAQTGSIAEQANAQAQAAVEGVSENVETTALESVASANTEESPENLLLAAREAYWSGELDNSVSFYQSLITKDDNPSHKGELANVYWKQGKSTEAVNLFAEIAPWLAEQGRMDELNSIKVYADMVDPAKASEIAKYIK